MKEREILTYCNPTPLPNYPIGIHCLDLEKWDYVKTQFRETADPSVLYEDGVWYLYSSAGLMYYSEDFVTWHHLELEPKGLYAPTIVKHRGKFYLAFSWGELYVADNPKGPFKNIGKFIDTKGEFFRVPDPMLFSDDDDRLYLYYGIGESIKCVELDSQNPQQAITEEQIMFRMDTENHLWERIGDWGEDGTYSYIEGPWMIKKDDTYYLTYAGPGTEWYTYAMGAYKGKSPLGPWEYMETSPFISGNTGLVRGPGHGSVVKGPNDTYWVFYTCCVCYSSFLERRIGYDPIGFDENGNIIPRKPTEIPQLAPGIKKDAYIDNNAGYLPLTQRKKCEASSNSPGRDALYAIDDNMTTFWQPDPEDKLPTLTVKLLALRPFEIFSARVIWSDIGIDVQKGHMPGAFGYKIEARVKDGEWICVLDKSDNSVDMLIDYNHIKQVKADEVRLVITKKPKNIEPGVVNFTVFGKRLKENEDK